MHVNQVRVMTVDFHQLIFVVTVHINWMKVRNMLVGKNVLRFSVLISRSIEVVKLQVLLLLLLIDTEVKVLVGYDFIVLARLKLLSSHFVFELKKCNLLFYNFVDFLFNVFQVMGSGLIAHIKRSWHCASLFEGF